jgi:hypothetical protein
MFDRRLPAVAIVSVSLLARGHAQAQGEALPEGTMQSKARVACTLCHDTRIIVQQRLTKALWAKEVDKMVKWGALLNVSDRDALIDYLSTNFPPERPAYLAPRSRPARKAAPKPHS